MVPRKKPASDVYDYALDKLGLPAEACLAIEDSVNGLRSANDAGLATLITVNPYTEKQAFTGALAVLDHLGEPDMPCRLLAGDHEPDGMVDVEYLVELHQQSVPA